MNDLTQEVRAEFVASVEDRKAEIEHGERRYEALQDAARDAREHGPISIGTTLELGCGCLATLVEVSCAPERNGTDWRYDETSCARGPVSYSWQSTPRLWSAVRRDHYDGAPDSHPLNRCNGLGRTQELARADLVEQESWHLPVGEEEVS